MLLATLALALCTSANNTLGVPSPAAPINDTNPVTEQLLLFVQPDASDLARRFHSEELAAVEQLCEELELPLRVIDASQAAPREIALTPLFVFQNWRGRSIYQGRSSGLDRLRNFLRTSRVVPQRDALLHRENLPVLRAGRAKVAAPIKITPLAGAIPEGFDNKEFEASMRSSLSFAFDRFEWTNQVQLVRSDRSFYFDIYPHLSDEGTLSLALAIFSQFHCKQPVFVTGESPITGPWDERANLFARAAQELERAAIEQIAGSDHGDGFDSLGADVATVTWEELGLGLPQKPATRAAEFEVSEPVAGLWGFEAEATAAVPSLQFRFPAPLEAYTGEVLGVQAELTLDPKQLGTATGWVEINPATVTMGDGDLDMTLQSSLFLHTSRYPSARFEMESFQSESSTLQWGELVLGEGLGTFEFKGAKVPLKVRTQLELALNEAGETELLASGAFEIRLAEDFRISGPDGPMPQRDTLEFDFRFPLAPPAHTDQESQSSASKQGRQD